MGVIGKIIGWLSNSLKIIGAACLMGMTLLTCADVVGRFFNHPVFGSVELVGFMSTLVCAMALPYTHEMKGHIGVELVVRLLSDKTQIIIDTITGFMSLVLMAVVTWRMVDYAHTMKGSGEVSMNLELPIHAVIYMVSFCFLVFSLIIMREFVNNIKSLKK